VESLRPLLRTQGKASVDHGGGKRMPKGYEDGGGGNDIGKVERREGLKKKNPPEKS